MPVRLLVTADIHGYYSAWQALLKKRQPDDMLLIAGDTFGTRYPDSNDRDYRPEDIRAELQEIPHLAVYGNCDIPAFSPGLPYTVSYVWNDKLIFMHHGDSLPLIPENAFLVISGHTHVPMVQFIEGRWLVNPGSSARPRAYAASYAIITTAGIQLCTLQGTPFITADFASKAVRQKPIRNHASADYE